MSERVKNNEFYINQWVSNFGVTCVTLVTLIFLLLPNKILSFILSFLGFNFCPRQKENKRNKRNSVTKFGTRNFTTSSLSNGKRWLIPVNYIFKQTRVELFIGES